MKFWSTFSLWSLVEKLSARLQYRHNLHGNSSATVELLQSCTKIQTTVSIFFNISLNIRKSKVNWKMIFCERKCMKTLLRILEKVIITKNGVTAILHYTDYRQDWAGFVPLLVSCSYNVLKTKIMNENDKSSLRGDGRPSFKWTVHVIV